VSSSPPTLYDWAGRMPAFERLTRAFYDRVLEDDLLEPVFRGMLAKHRGPALTRSPCFRSAFVAYVEWGTRLAVSNSQPDASPAPDAPVPRWGWGEAPPYTG
jgi:hemoglobin